MLKNVSDNHPNLMYIVGMEQKKKSGGAPKKRGNKTFVGAWVTDGLFERVKKLAKKRGHENVSSVLAEALKSLVDVENIPE